MARARNIKPGFFKNESLADSSCETRLLFIGLWTLADREGRLEDRPRRIRAEIFPFDGFDVESMLNELQSLSFLTRYEVDGDRFIQITNFVKHQDPHYKEKASDIPPPGGSENTIKAINVTRTQRTRILERDEYKCQNCASIEHLCIDHIIPASRGGDSSDNNLQVLCISCNTKKGNKLNGETKGMKKSVHNQTAVIVRSNVESTLNQNQSKEVVTNRLIPDSLIPDSLIPDSLIPDSLIPDSLIPDSIQPASACDPEKFSMRIGWQPSPHVADLARQSMTEIKPDKLGEFIAHWLTDLTVQRTQAEWDKTLLQSAKHDKLRSQSPLPSKEKPVRKPVKNKNTAQIAPECVFPEIKNRQFVNDWLVIRKVKYAAVTQTALDGIAREARKAGMQIDDAIRMCCERNWSGFKASWLDGDSKGMEAGKDHARETARVMLFGDTKNATI